MDSGLKFIQYFVTNISFKVNEEVLISSKKYNVEYDISHEIEESIGDKKLYKVHLTYATKQTETSPFDLALEVVGIFELIGEDSEYITENAVTILFPYLRNAISSITLNANLPAYVLQPMNIIELLKQDKKPKKNK